MAAWTITWSHWCFKFYLFPALNDRPLKPHYLNPIAENFSFRRLKRLVLAPLCSESSMIAALAASEAAELSSLPASACTRRLDHTKASVITGIWPRATDHERATLLKINLIKAAAEAKEASSAAIRVDIAPVTSWLSNMACLSFGSLQELISTPKLESTVEDTRGELQQVCERYSPGESPHAIPWSWACVRLLKA
jgi:hypothetical protein